MKTLIFASNNAHKLVEVKSKLGTNFNIQSMNEIGCFDDIPETSTEFEGNAEIKARWVWEKYGLNCFADDSGLSIDALNGEPGVYSARFAGENCSFEDNNKKVLTLMQNHTSRKAHFITVICLIWAGKTYFFKGIVNGEILKHHSGIKGFGYDPIFKPDGESQSYAEMSIEQKNLLSHRAKALELLKAFLDTKIQ